MEMMKELMKKAKRVWTALVYVLTLEINPSSSTPITNFKHSNFEHSNSEHLIYDTIFDNESFNDYETYWHDSIYYSSYDDSSYHHSYYDDHGLFDKFGSSVDYFGSFSFDFNSFND